MYLHPKTRWEWGAVVTEMLLLGVFAVSDYVAAVTLGTSWRIQRELASALLGIFAVIFPNSLVILINELVKSNWIGYLITTVAAFPIFLWIGRRLNSNRRWRFRFAFLGGYIIVSFVLYVVVVWTVFRLP